MTVLLTFILSIFLSNSSLKTLLNNSTINIDANASTEFSRYREDGVSGPLECPQLVIAFSPIVAGVAFTPDNCKHYPTIDSL